MTGIFKKIVFGIFFALLTLFVLEHILFVRTANHPWFGYWDYGISEPNPKETQNLPYDDKKGDIVTIGDGYVYGNWFDPLENSLAWKLQKATGRRTFNRGFWSTGISAVLWQLENAEFFKRDDLKTDYVIYVYYPEHLNRMFLNYTDKLDVTKNLRYKKTKNGLEPLPKNEPLKDSFRINQTYRRLNEFLVKHKSAKEKLELLKLHLEQAKAALNKRFPEAKFVVVIYEGINAPESEKLKNELKEQGFIIVDFSGSEFDGLRIDEYKTEGIPSGKAWDELVPLITQSINETENR